MQIVIQREVCSYRSSKSPVVHFFMCGLAVRAQPEGQKKKQEESKKARKKEKKRKNDPKTKKHMRYFKIFFKNKK